MTLNKTPNFSGSGDVSHLQKWEARALARAVECPARGMGLHRPAFGGCAGRLPQPSPGLPKDHTVGTVGYCSFLGSRHPNHMFCFPTSPEESPGPWTGFAGVGGPMRKCLPFSNSAKPVKAHNPTKPLDMVPALCGIRVPLSLKSRGKTSVLLFIIIISLGTHKNLSFPLVSRMVCGFCLWKAVSSFPCIFHTHPLLPRYRKAIRCFGKWRCRSKDFGLKG